MAVRFKGGWNGLGDTGKRLAVEKGMVPRPDDRFKDNMFNADQVNQVVDGLRRIAGRFPKVRPALQAAEQAQVAWNKGEALISQDVLWD